MKINKKILFVGLISFGFMMSCGGDTEKPNNDTPTAEEPTAEEPVAEVDPMDNVGVGPIKELILGELDNDMVVKGKEFFDLKCASCHSTKKRKVGPNMTGVMERRNAAWVMNMILEPDLMVKEDPIAKALLAEYLAPMAKQNLTEEEARSVVEYFRTLKEEK